MRFSNEIGSLLYFKLMHEYKHIQLVLIIYCEYLGLLEKRLCMEIYWFVVDSSNGSFLKFVCFIYRMSQMINT